MFRILFLGLCAISNVSAMMISSGGASHHSSLPETEDIVSRLMTRLENPSVPISACPKPGKFYDNRYGTKYYRAMAVLYNNCESPSSGSERVEGAMSSRESHLRNSFINLIHYEDNVNPRLVQGKEIVKQLYTLSTSSSPIPDQNFSIDTRVHISFWMTDYLVPAILPESNPQLQPTMAMSDREPSGSSASSTDEGISQILDKWKQFLEDPSNGLPRCQKTANEYHEQFGIYRFPALAALIDVCVPPSALDISQQRQVLERSFLVLSKTKVSAQPNIYVEQGTLIANELVSLIRNSRYAIESDESDGPFDVLSKFVNVLLPGVNNSPSSILRSEGGSSSVSSERGSTLERHSRLSSPENQNIRPQRNLVSGSPLYSTLYSVINNQRGNTPGPSGIQQGQVSGLQPHQPQAPTLNAITTSQYQPGSTVEGPFSFPISRFFHFSSLFASKIEQRVRVGGQIKREKLLDLRMPGMVGVVITNDGIKLYLRFGSSTSPITNSFPGSSIFEGQQHVPLSRVLEYISGEAQKMESNNFSGVVQTFIPLHVAGSGTIRATSSTLYKLVFQVQSNIPTTGRALQQSAGPSNQNNGNALQSGGSRQTSGTQVQGVGSEIVYDSEMYKDVPISLEPSKKRQKTHHSTSSNQGQSSQNTSSGSTSTQGNSEQGR